MPLCALALQGQRHWVVDNVGEVVRPWDIFGVVGILDVRNWRVFTTPRGLRGTTETGDAGGDAGGDKGEKPCTLMCQS
jgi:hypothetical protein